MDLISTLKTQHELISFLSSEISVSVAAQDAARVSRLLTKLRTVLCAHLALEDAELYAALIEAGKSPRHETLGIAARLMRENMTRITVALMTFFDKHQGSDLDLAKFEVDWRYTAQVLESRAAAEEQALYPLFAKIVSRDQQSQALLH